MGSALGRWLVLVVSAITGGTLAMLLGLPAAWLIGSLLATLALTCVQSEPPALPRVTYAAAQAVVGVALSASFDPRALLALARYWPLIVASVVLIFGLSIASGLALARFAHLDPATAVLGMIPGGAPGMVAMSEDVGANTPLVACMQYTRLCVVTISASLLARFGMASAGHAFAVHSDAAMLEPGWSQTISGQWVVYGRTTLIALIGAWAGLRLRVPAGALVGPVLLGVVAGAMGVAHGTWPPAVLPAANVLIGVWIGLRFDRAAIGHVGRLLGPIIGVTSVLIAGCGVVSWTWVAAVGLDPLTAYLATTPGGIDAVTIAALDSGANLSLILPVQVLRLLAMVLAGPFLVRWLHKRFVAARLDRETRGS